MSRAGLTVASHPALLCVLFWSQKAALRSVVAGALVLLVAGAIPFCLSERPSSARHSGGRRPGGRAVSGHLWGTRKDPGPLALRQVVWIGTGGY